jgi:hypothetical protein
MYKLKTGRHFEKNFPSHTTSRGTAAEISKRRGSSALDNIKLKVGLIITFLIFNVYRIILLLAMLFLILKCVLTLAF